MVDLALVKDPTLQMVLEESDNFKALPEAEKQKYLDRIMKLSADQQKELCKFFVREEKDTLPTKLLVRFLQKVNNSMTALTTVAAKDKAILNKYREGRSGESEAVI
ncbi:MAG: hypothetical protein WC285_03725 [Candidatus Gracilibacteria bacterium]|jgi:hypothetical protein